MLKPWLTDFVPGFRVGLADNAPGFHVDGVSSDSSSPSATDPNIVPTGAPSTPCSGGWCKEGGRYAARGIIPHPQQPGKHLCPYCALKDFDMDIRDPEVRKLLDR